MSKTEMKSNYHFNSFIFRSGERYGLLFDRRTGLPLYHPNQFVTTQVRNKSLSHSSMVTTLSGIGLLLTLMDERKQNIEESFARHEYFEINELDAIRDFCQTKFKSRTNEPDPNGMFNLKELRELGEQVASNTVYVRLTVIANYLDWLAKLLSSKARNKEVTARISEMKTGLLERRPEKKGRNGGLISKGVDEKQLAILFELFRPDSSINPFEDMSVRIRNRLMFLLLYHLGLRGGELLNIRIRDIDFSRNQLVVIRRADEKDDTRTEQALAKTRDRRLPLKETLVKEIHNYILKVRRQIVRRGQPDYLFVVHKSGPTQGLPLSKSGYKKVVKLVRLVSPALYKLTGHVLRHDWNERFSDMMDNKDNPPSEIEQEAIRSQLMGWKPESGTAAIYNQRFTQRKADEAGLLLQEGMVRLPKDLGHE